MRYVKSWFSVGAVALLLAGCGGGGGGGGGGLPNNGGTTTEFALGVENTTGAALPAHVQGVTFSANLPQGATIATNPDGTMAPGVLTPAAGFNDPGQIVSGSVNGSVARVSLATPADGFEVLPATPLEVARLKVSLPPGTTLTPANVALNQAAGIEVNPQTQLATSFDLTGSLRPTVTKVTP